MMQEATLIDAGNIIAWLNVQIEKARRGDLPIDAIAYYVDAVTFVKNLPTIEPKVRRGRWIPTEYDSYADGAPVWDKWECSECGNEHSGEKYDLTAFCPDCGAKMDGGTDDAS